MRISLSCSVMRSLLVEAIAVVMVLLIAGCGEGPSPVDSVTLKEVSESYPLRSSGVRVGTLEKSEPAGLSVTVISLAKQSERRISRTVYEYIFTVTVQNSGQTATAISAKITGSGAGTTIIDGTIAVGDLISGQSVTPGDTITLRQDRTQAFDPTAIVWSFSGTVVTPPPPPPPPPGESVAGTDANGDGVRDDVEAHIGANYASPPESKAALLQLARAWQQALLSTDSTSAAAAQQARLAAGRCLAETVGPVLAQSMISDVYAVQINTLDRVRAEVAYRNLTRVHVSGAPGAPRSTCR